MYVQSKSCGKCGSTVDLKYGAGDTCPHCGAYWSGMQTRVVGGSESSSSESGWVGAVVWIGLLLLAAALSKAC